LSERWSAQVHGDDGVTTIALAGEIDLVAAPEVRTYVSGALAESPRRLVIDLSNVTFIDSTGVQALVVAHQTTRLLKVELVLVPGQPQVMRTLELAGVEDLLTFER
jgi:anti-anti-sigma factor